jgi:hypothetical protein
MAEQLWDDVIYPVFRATIRGQYYATILRDAIDEECYFLTKRAVNAFKFPKISTDYTTIYAIRIDDNTLEQIKEDDERFEYAIPHAYFNNTLTDAEIEVLVAWMKVFWCENQISNADNFEEMYTDVNIKTYSRANMVDKNLKLLETYREYARDLENRYSRVNKTRQSSLGEINSDE